MASIVSLLDTFTGTHDTDGLAGYPAIDVSGAAGSTVTAPASGVLVSSHFIPWDIGKKVGGWTTYLVTTKGVYFLTHFGQVLPSGTQVKAGQPIGTVAAVPGGAWAPHIHEGFHAGPDPRLNFGAATNAALLGSGGGGFWDAINPQNWLIPSPSDQTVWAGAKHIPGVQQGADVVNAIDSTGKFLGKITSPGFLLQAAQVVGGAVLVLVGMTLLAKQIALGGTNAPAPIQQAATALA